MADQIEMQLTFKGESAEELKATLDRAGAQKIEARNERGMLGLETVLICFLLAEETAKLITWLTRTWKCGVVVTVDSRGKKVSTEKNCDLPCGTVLLVHPDGTQVTLQEPPEAKLADWFKDAFKAISGKG